MSSSSSSFFDNSASNSSGSGSTPSWPENLPAPLIDRTHSITPRSTTTLMESQRPRVRRMQVEQLELMQVQWNFTEDQYRHFRDFFIGDLETGVRKFHLMTFEPAQQAHYYVVVERIVEFLDGKYQFSQEDNLFSVVSNLIVDSEHTSLPIPIPGDIPPKPPLPPLDIPIPTITYSTCNDTITIDYGATIPGLKRYLIETSSDGIGWSRYTEARRERSRLVLNNYFPVGKHIRVRFIKMDLTIQSDPHSVFVVSNASNVAAPVISVTGFHAPLFHLPSNYLGVAGADNSSVLVVANLEEIDLNGNKIMKIPCGEAFIEATKQEYILTHYGDPQTPSTMEIDLSSTTAGATCRFTLNGADPSGPLDGLASGTVISPYLDNFGCVLIARAFKDGCPSPPTYLLVDKNVGLDDRFETEVLAADTSTGCQLRNWQRLPPDCPALGQPINRTCASIFNFQEGSYPPTPHELIALLNSWWLGITGSLSGPSSHLALILSDVTGAESGATTDPGTCGSGSVWSNGDFNFTGSLQEAVDLTGEPSGAFDTALRNFPDSITEAYLQNSNGTVAKGRLVDDYFGPTRQTGAYTATVLETQEPQPALLNQEIASEGGARFGQQVTALLNVASTSLTTLKFVCTLAPEYAPDIWNPDDLL